ncbi:AraC family transcriptional regulator [Nakamurella silvestris]|nr:AraC family transcriptional regulator [Nakamurella silvestris]
MSGTTVAERYEARGHRFAPHSHDEFVISANGLEVEREFVRLDRQRFDVGVEEVTVYNPGQVQASTALTRDGAPWECFSIHVDAATVAELTGGRSIDLEHPVVVDQALAHTIRSIAALSDLRTAAEQTLWVISEVLHRGSGSPPAQQDPTLVGATALSSLLRELREDLAEPVSIPALAAQVSVSPDHFIRSFVAAVGVPPYAWHLQERLSEGRRRLRAGVAPTVVAAELGFSDQAHFHRHFVAAYARTPGQMRSAQVHGIIQA